MQERPLTVGSAGKFAAALFDVAQSENKIAVVGKELKTFAEACAEDKDLVMELESPLLYGDQFKPVIEEICADLEIKSEECQSLIEELVISRKLKRLPKIVADFDRLAQWEANEVIANVTSATPLNAQQLKKLEAALKSQLNDGETLVLNTHVNPELLGGLTVELGERAIDLSVASRLSEVDAAVRG